MLPKLQSVDGWTKDFTVQSNLFKLTFNHVNKIKYMNVDIAISQYCRNVFINVINFIKSWMLRCTGRENLKYFGRALLSYSL